MVCRSATTHPQFSLGSDRREQHVAPHPSSATCTRSKGLSTLDCRSGEEERWHEHEIANSPIARVLHNEEVWNTIAPNRAYHCVVSRIRNTTLAPDRATLQLKA